MFLGQAATRRPSCLHSLKLLSILDASADAKDHFTQRRPHRDFNQSDIIDFACQGKHFRSFTFFRTYATEPLCSFQEDNRHIRIRFHIIYIGRTTFITLFAGKRRLNGRLSAKSLHTMDQSSLFTTDESACPVPNFDIEGEIRPEDIFT